MKTVRQFTKDEILNSKGYVKGVTTFEQPTLLFKDLLDIETDKFNIGLNASHEIINVNEDLSENISFGRMDLQYTFNIDDELQYNLGLIIALDKGKPIAKIYSGTQVKACLNMCIFGAEQIHRFDINTTGFSYRDVFKNEFKGIEEKVKKAKVIIKNLKSIHLTTEKIHTLNGAILHNIIKNNGVVGTNPILNGIKLQSDRNSKYNSKEGLNAWLYYNSLTEYLNEKIHILDIPEKALNVFDCVKEFLNEDLNQIPINLIEIHEPLEITESVAPKSKSKTRKQLATTE